MRFAQTIHIGLTELFYCISMKSLFFRNILSYAAILLASAMPFAMPHALAQDNWAADDDALEARKIERYQQLVDQSPEKS